LVAHIHIVGACRVEILVEAALGRDAIQVVAHTARRPSSVEVGWDVLEKALVPGVVAQIAAEAFGLQRASSS